MGDVLHKLDIRLWIGENLDKFYRGQRIAATKVTLTVVHSAAMRLVEPALGVSVKSVHLVAGRLGFYSQSGRTKDFKNSIRSFRARRSAQAEVRRVLCMCCSSCYVP